MTDTDDRPTITRHQAADMIDALHAAPDGYHDGMADPAYALSSAGGVVIWWTGPTTREIADRNLEIALHLEPEDRDDPDDDDEIPDAIAWELIARDPALADLETEVADVIATAEESGIDGDPLDHGAEAARQWFRDRGLDRIADTVIVERGVWTKGPRITFQALGW